ncbi:Protein HIRA, partial [Ophiophagus hannah]
QKNGSSTKPSCPYCCCAVGSKDRSLSVWLTCLKRPLVVIHELFDKSIMDISWTLNGLGILVCSMDGSVAFLDFSQDELGDPLSDEEKSNIHQLTYGKSLAIMTEAHLSTAIIENPEMLKYQQRQQQVEKKNEALRDGTGSGAAIMAPRLASMVNGESLEDIRKNLLKKQVETRTADGRRRITPLCIAQLDTGYCFQSILDFLFCLETKAGSMMSASQTNQLIALDYNAANSLGTVKPALEPMAAAAKSAEDVANKDGVNTTSTSAPLPASSSSVLPTSSKIEPMKAFDSRFTERSKATSGTSPVSHTNQVTLDSSSDSEEKLAIKPLSLSKRKLDLEVEKKKKGRPRKDSRLMPVTLTVQSPAILSSDKDGACHSTPLALKLPTPVLQKSFALQVSSDPSMYIEVENEITTVGGAKLSRLKCNREGKEWETVLTSRILSAAGSCEVVSVACEKRTLSVFSASGRRLLPPIVLHSPISTLHCTGFYIMALTTAATLSVWNLVSDKQETLAQCADFRSSLPSQEAMLCSGPLAIIQGRMSKKRDLLKELLPVIGQNLRFQRLFTEYQEQLDILKDK